MDNTANQQLAIVVSSCDAYSDVWPAFFTLFFRYWPDCPYQVYLIGNKQSWPDTRIKTILINPDRRWSDNLRAALDQVREKYILYMQEDYLLQAKVDANKISQLFNFVIQEKAACLRLQPTPGPDLPYQNNPEIGEISKTEDYRVSLQAAIWDKQAMLSLLADGEDGWQMEFEGTKRSRQVPMKFLSVKRDVPRPLPYFCTAVLKGKWMRQAVEFCRKENIAIDTGKRPVRSFADDFKDKAKGLAVKIYFALKPKK
ncbi:MAG: hypothetical protein M1383_02000 [Patescibacteria group bacterium]|nr:hypothetical protein [Patescibacteria group bacterium]